MTQKPRLRIDTNKHGIRREVNLDVEYRASMKKKEKANRPKTWKKKTKDA